MISVEEYNRLERKLGERYAEDLMRKEINALTDIQGNKITLEISPESILVFDDLEFWDIMSLKYSKDGFWLYLTAQVKKTQQ